MIQAIQALFDEGDCGKKRQNMASTCLVLFVLIVSSLVALSDGWCTYSSDCESANQVCCNNQCVHGSSCVGRSCTFKSDCASGESCCNNQCKASYDCIGYSCTIDSDCGNWESCCFGTCQNTYDDCYDGTAIIVGSIFGSLLVIFLIAICIFFACRRQRRVRHGRVIVGGRVTTTATTTTTRNATQTNPLYPGQAPQSYQQGYPYYPPPQYEQQQTAIPPIPPPYSLAGTATQPPPYTGAPQGGSGGGVYNPKPSYGAVPSAPPV